MNIREIHENKKQFLPLLLLADEQEDMIDRYLERGTMYVLEDGGVRAECVVTDEGVRYFVADCPADALLRVQNRPERRGALPVTALPNPEPLRSGTGMPLTRWTAAGEFVGMMDEHSGD